MTTSPHLVQFIFKTLSLQVSHQLHPDFDVMYCLHLLYLSLQVGPPQKRGRGKALTPTESAHSQPTVLGELVLVLKAGDHHVTNLPEPVSLTFNNSEMVQL